MFRFFPILAIAALAAATVPPVDGWAGEPARPHHADLAVEAARLLPPEERALILRHEEAFRQGANDPDRFVDPYYHRDDPDDPAYGGAVEKARETYDEAVARLREGDEGAAAYKLGEMTHYVLDLAQPMHSGGWDAISSPWHEDYENAAYDNRHELRIDPARGPVPRSPDVAAMDASRSGRDLWPLLELRLDRAAGPWSEEIADVTERAVSEGVLAAADALHAAILASGAARAAQGASSTGPPAQEPPIPPAAPPPPGRDGPDAAGAPPAESQAPPETDDEGAPGERQAPRVAAFVLLGALITLMAAKAALALRAPRAPARDEEAP